MIVFLVKEERPLLMFGMIGLAMGVVSLVLGVPIVAEFLGTGLVPRFPTAILAASVMVIAVLSVMAGLILDTVTLGRREMKRMAYLALPAVSRK
jgi:hypothetical protein